MGTSGFGKICSAIGLQAERPPAVQGKCSQHPFAADVLRRRSRNRVSPIAALMASKHGFDGFSVVAFDFGIVSRKRQPIVFVDVQPRFR